MPQQTTSESNHSKRDSNVNFHAALQVIMNRTMIERKVSKILVSIVMQYCHI